MPIFEFQCNKCDHIFEELCSFEDSKKARCSNCKSKKITRLFSGVIGLGLNSSFDFQAKKNYARAQQESAAARAIAGQPYRPIDDTKRGMNYIV